MTNKTNNSLGFTGLITSMASFNAELNIDGGTFLQVELQTKVYSMQLTTR